MSAENTVDYIGAHLGLAGSGVQKLLSEIISLRIELNEARKEIANRAHCEEEYRKQVKQAELERDHAEAICVNGIMAISIQRDAAKEKVVILRKALEYLVERHETSRMQVVIIDWSIPKEALEKAKKDKL